MAKHEIKMNDVLRPETVEISIDKNSVGGLTIWVNVDGVCALRTISPTKISISVLRHEIYSETNGSGK